MIIGDGTVVHPLSNIYCESIGRSCRIANFVEIGRGVTIGDYCSIQAFVYIPEGVVINDNVFIGPHVCFTNCKYPVGRRKRIEAGMRGDTTKLFHAESTLVESDVVIGAGSVIMCGVVIGKGAVIGAGSVIVKDVRPGEKVIQKRANLSNILVKQPDGRIERL